MCPTRWVVRAGVPRIVPVWAIVNVLSPAWRPAVDSVWVWAGEGCTYQSILVFFTVRLLVVRQGFAPTVVIVGV